MIGNSQRLQGYRSYGVRRAISSTPSKVTGLRRLQRSLSDKFQRYSPNFDIIIIIIILEVDIKGCEVAKVSGFHRAIFTHITCHYCMSELTYVWRTPSLNHSLVICGLLGFSCDFILFRGDIHHTITQGKVDIVETGCT